MCGVSLFLFVILWYNLLYIFYVIFVLYIVLLYRLSLFLLFIEKNLLVILNA